ncbi:MAG: insulinase family protein [Holosporaceae bacterium]|jgi:zinc protease|nr:insulinase family protein [Holosporaceae bacterium]
MIVIRKFSFVFIFIGATFFLAHGEKWSDLERTSSLKQLFSSSGIKFWFMQDNSASLVHLRIVFKNSGASHQEKHKAGLPKFYSHAVFCGSGKYNTVEFKRKCSDISLKLSCQAGLDTVIFSMTAPKIVMTEAAELLNVALSSPIFDRDKVKEIQDGIGYSIQNYALNPVVSALHIFVPSIIFKSHAYESGTQGSSENFMKLSIDDLKKYKEKFLVTANAEACIFGDVSEKEAISLLDRVLFKIEKGQPAEDHVPDTTPLLSSEIVKYYAEGTQSAIIFITKNEKPLSHRRAAAMILYRILGENCLFKSRIMSELRMKQGLIYSEFMVPIDLNHANYIFGVLLTDNSKVSQTMAALTKVIKNLRENGVTNEELEFAQKNITGSLLVGLRTSGDLCDFCLKRMIDGVSLDRLFYFLKEVAEAQLEDVNKLAKDLLDENNMSWLVIGGAA